MKSQNSTNILLLASIPAVLALVGYEFPSHNYLHPHPLRSDVFCGVQKCVCASIPRPLHSLSHLHGPLTQLERTEKEVSYFWNSPLAMSKDFPHIPARKLKSGKIISSLWMLRGFLGTYIISTSIHVVPVGRAIATFSVTIIQLFLASVGWEEILFHCGY